jgi:hypothetical protein
VETLTAAGDSLFATTRTELLRLAHDGRELRRTRLAAKPSAPSLIDPDNNVFVPTEVGTLLVVDAAGRVVDQLKLARSALHAPVWHATGKQVIVTTGEGLVFGVRRGTL